MAGWSFVADLPAGLWGKEKREIRGSSTQQQRKRLYLDLYNSIFIIWYLWGRLFFTWCLDYSFVHRLDGFVAHGAPVGTARNKRTCQKKKMALNTKWRNLFDFFLFRLGHFGLIQFLDSMQRPERKTLGARRWHHLRTWGKIPQTFFLIFSLKEQIEVEFNSVNHSDFILNFWI